MPIKIKSIKYIGKVEQQCIEVKAEDGLYLTEDNIVTHNSALAMQNGVNYKIINGAGSILGQNIISAVISELTMFSENGWSDDKIFTFFTKRGFLLSTTPLFLRFFVDFLCGRLTFVLKDI